MVSRMDSFNVSIQKTRGLNAVHDYVIAIGGVLQKMAFALLSAAAVLPPHLDSAT